MADYVRLIHQQPKGTYGWRRIRAELLDEYEMIVNHKLIEAIITEHGIAGVPRANAFRHPLIDTRTDTDLVNRIFTADGPNRPWLTDVTEHPRQGRQGLLLRGAGLLRTHRRQQVILDHQ